MPPAGLILPLAMSTSRHLPGGWANPKKLPRGPNGRALCRWCSSEVQPPRRTFCSDDCVHQWRLRSSASYVREQVLKRDRGVCAVKKNGGVDLGFVGEISAADSRWLDAIWSHGGVPVLSSVALGSDGQYYNVNADQMAAACAIACHANALIFLTDVSGVRDKEGAVIRWLNAHEIKSLVSDSVVSGGMLPKLEACRQALANGVGRVRILPAAQVEAVADFFISKIDLGTEVMPS